MPVEITIDPERRRIRSRLSGRLCRDTLRAYYEALTAHPDFRPDLSEVFDVGDVSELDLTADEIRVALTPFGQVGHAQRAENAGTGLGLPLARAMMELHGGRLTVRSAPGRGTTVVLIFPATRVLPAPPNVMPLHASGPRGERAPAAEGLNSADIIPLNTTGPERSKHQP